MAYRPVTNAEWSYLQRRFAALERRPGMRELFNNSLEGSPYEASERRQFRRDIFEQVREMASPLAAYQNPYFELSWFRAVQQQPSLNNNLNRNRALLYEAFFERAEPRRVREEKVAQWLRLTGAAPGEAGLETITDGEEAEIGVE